MKLSVVDQRKLAFELIEKRIRGIDKGMDKEEKPMQTLIQKHKEEVKQNDPITSSRSVGIGSQSNR